MLKPENGSMKRQPKVYKRRRPTDDERALFKKMKRRIDRIVLLIEDYEDLRRIAVDLGYQDDPEWLGDEGSQVPWLELCGNMNHTIVDSSDLDFFLKQGPRDE